VYAFFAGFLAIFRLQAATTLEWIGSWSRAEYLVPVLMFIPVISILIHQYRLARIESSRKKIRLVIFSILFTSSLTTLFYIVPPLLGLSGLDANFVGVLLLLFPVSVAIAILQYTCSTSMSYPPHFGLWRATAR
jgi:hypothetical protein